MPDTSDPGRWTNRVVNNLLYYQTNYFVSALIVFFFVRLVDIPVSIQFDCSFWSLVENLGYSIFKDIIHF